MKNYKPSTRARAYSAPEAGAVKGVPVVPIPFGTSVLGGKGIGDAAQVDEDVENERFNNGKTPRVTSMIPLKLTNVHFYQNYKFQK